MTGKRELEIEVSLDNPKCILVWFEKALSFVEVLSNDFENSICRINRTKYCMESA